MGAGGQLFFEVMTAQELIRSLQEENPSRRVCVNGKEVSDIRLAGSDKIELMLTGLSEQDILMKDLELALDLSLDCEELKCDGKFDAALMAENLLKTHVDHTLSGISFPTNHPNPGEIRAAIMEAANDRSDASP